MKVICSFCGSKITVFGKSTGNRFCNSKCYHNHRKNFRPKTKKYDKSTQRKLKRLVARSTLEKRKWKW